MLTTQELGKVKKELSSKGSQLLHFHIAQVVNVGEESKVADHRESESGEDGTNMAVIGNLIATVVTRFGVCGCELVKTLQEKWFIEPLEIHRD